MKQNITRIASIAQIAILSLLVCTAWSCSGEDELDEMLSTATTPITFQTGTLPYVFFDYTDGWRLIGSDTISAIDKNRQHTFNLHQGKHRVVFAENIESSAASGIHFNPSRRTFYLVSERVNLDDYGDVWRWSVARERAAYGIHSVEVTPYLMPTQQPQRQYVTATLTLTITDLNNRDIMPGQDIRWSGSITDIPVVEEVGIGDDKSYKLRAEPHIWYVSFYRQSDYGMYPLIIYQYTTLCPLNGLNDIALSCTVTDERGQVVPTTPLPTFSLRRGYTTILSGPLYSGSASDWTVEMQPYD